MIAVVVAGSFVRLEGDLKNRTIAIFLWPAKRESGKKKAHKHKSFWPVTPPVTGGLPTGSPGVKVLCAILGAQGT